MTLSQLRSMRLRGQRPAHMILLSLVGRVMSPNPCIDVAKETDPDWRVLAGLDVQIVHAGQTARVVNLCSDLVQIPVRSLSVWNPITMRTILVEDHGHRCIMEAPCS